MFFVLMVVCFNDIFAQPLAPSQLDHAKEKSQFYEDSSSDEEGMEDNFRVSLIEYLAV